MGDDADDSVMTEPGRVCRSGFLFVRISAEDIILYANAAMADYARAPKDELIGTPLEVFRNRLEGEIFEVFGRPERGRSENRLVTDANGRVFELRTYSESGVLDIVLDEVTRGLDAYADLLSSTGTAEEALTEEELRILHHPEQRFATVTVTTLCRFAQVAHRSSAEETHLMLNAFTEECCEAILATGATIGDVATGCVTGIFGAPRYYRDHAFRAVLSACKQASRLSGLHDAFSKQGREMPPCTIGIASGDLQIGTLEGGGRLMYSTAGAASEIASILTRIARPGEVLLTEEAFQHSLASLPEEWEHARAESESDPDLSDLEWSAGEIEALPENLRRVIYLAGPRVSAEPALTEICFGYLYALRPHRGSEAIPILRAVSPQATGFSIELDHQRVVTASPVQVLGKYRLIELIGQGGMGKVWRAEDRFGNPVAIKVLTLGEGADSAVIKRFKREAEVMARLPHRNICRVYEFNEFEGINYIAMEYVEGLTLHELLYAGAYDRSGKEIGLKGVSLPSLVHSLRSDRQARRASSAAEPPDLSGPNEAQAERNRILPLEQTLAIIARICDAVQFAHEHGVLHRDLKPGNILIREDGEPLVVDFGLAKFAGGDDALSVSGNVVGTLENMAPEQAMSSKDVDERADVFSIGTILYQMVTGRRFFRGTGNILGDAQSLQTYEPPKPRSVNRHIDGDLEILTLKALRISPDERYRNAEALRSDIERYRRGEPITAKPVTAGELVRKLIQRNRAISVVLAASVVMLLAGTAVAFVLISGRYHEAEAARQEAEAATRRAEEQRSIAEKARLLELEGRRTAEEALQEAKTARAAEAAARDLQAQAMAQAEELAAEKNAVELERRKISGIAEKRAQQLRQAQQALEALSEKQSLAEGSAAKGERDRARLADARKALRDAWQIYISNFTPQRLDTLAGAAQAVEQIETAMDLVSRALAYDPAFFPAWMLKTRLHLACFELDEAAASLAEAGKLAAEDSRLVADDPPTDLQKIIGTLTKASSKPIDLIQALHTSTNAADSPAGSALAYLNSNATLKRKGSSNTYSYPRRTTPGELALFLRKQNPAPCDLRVTRLEDGRMAVAILNPARPLVLDGLQNQNVRKISIHGAAGVEWDAILALDCEEVELTRCEIRNPSWEGPRPASHMRRLNLSGSNVTSLQQLQPLQLLEELNISNTAVRDLAPLAGKRIRILDISGLALPSLQQLDWLPLEKLTLSPNVLPSLATERRLRAHRTLRVLRAPQDPSGQSPLDFWRRYDSGELTGNSRR